MIYKNGYNLSEGIFEFLKESNNIYIFIPYIKLEPLKLLIESSDNIKAIFIRWEAKDLIYKSSDLEIYPYLKKKGIFLYRNPRIHLKAYTDNFKRCFLTSANVSSRALNTPHFENYNYEIGTIVNNLSFDDRYYFSLIESESLLIDDSIYNQFCEQIESHQSDFYNDTEVKIEINTTEKDFLISSLPMSNSVEILCRIHEHHEIVSDTELNCALHDLATYKIPLGISSDEFLTQLTISFFSHVFIQSFLQFVDAKGEIYFGTAKEWIHKNCADVPTPRKWEITENIQILFRWIVTLSNGKYEVDRPNHSERLRLVN
jgi:hypothetical protein